MALILTEGFDHFIASLATAKGWSAAPASMQTGRLPFTGSQCFRIGNTTVRTKTLPSSYATLFGGFAFRFSALPAALTNIFVFRVGVTEVYKVQLTTGGKLQVSNASGTIATGTTTLNPNTFYYIETKAVINGASGSCEVRLNGAAGEISTTTGNFGSSNIDTITLQSGGGGTNHDFDDIYIADSTGGAPLNTFLGDVAVETLMPTADGAHTDWTPDSGSPHFSRVNEESGTFPDGDTSYVSDATVGHRDSYAFSDLLALTGTVFAVQTVAYARKDDAALRQIAVVARPGSTDQDGATITLGTSYAFFTEIRPTNPDTGVAWTISGVNGSEFGVKTVA